MSIYSPSKEFQAQANLGLEEYNRLQEQFKDKPKEFWSKLAKENIYWKKGFEEVFSYTKKPFFEWFKGGKTNISYNCIDRHLKTRADKAALVFEGEPGDKKVLTYSELHREVCKAANLLKSIGIKKGDTVCIYMLLCPEAIIAMQACMRIGAIHSVVFAGFSAHALRDRIKDLKSSFIITADGLFRRGKAVPLLEAVYEAIAEMDHIKKILCYRRINSDLKFNNITLDWQEEVSKQAEDCEPEWLDSEDTSFILYTSGSTGKPKGIRHTTAGYLLWAHLTCKWVFDLKDSDLYWCTADIGWITGHTYVSYGPLSNGASIFIYEGAPNFPNESRFWKMIENYKISIFYTAPTAIRAFMQWGLEHIKKHDLSSLRLLGSVGEPINPSAWEWFYKEIGNSKCPIVDTWWQTETGGIMISTLPGIHDMKPGSAGLALPGIETEISEAGLLYLKNPVPSMARSIHGDDERYIDTYWRCHPEETESTKDPMHQQDWSTGSFALGAQDDDMRYLAGDSATQDSDSYIKIGGRIDDVINISGHRLGTAEVESALVLHELVSEAAVVAIPHPIKGEGIVAFCVINCHPERIIRHPERSEGSNAKAKTGPLDSSPTALNDELKEQVVTEIGAIARPERIIICSGLPKTRSGKIMRRLLKDIAQGKEVSGDLSTIEDKTVIDQLKALAVQVPNV